MAAIFSNQHEYNELRPLTDERSLSALYFAGKYRIMDFALSSIVNAGINNVYTLISQEKVRSYLDHLGGGKEWGLDTIGSYAYLDFYQKLLQSQANGGEYFNDLITFLATANAPYTVFLENKIVANVDLQSVLHFHQENENRITAVFKRVSKKNVALLLILVKDLQVLQQNTVQMLMNIPVICIMYMTLRVITIPILKCLIRKIVTHFYTVIKELLQELEMK